MKQSKYLSTAEESTLSRWVTRLTRTGFPASLVLVVEIAEEIRRGRVWLLKDNPEPLRPIDENRLNCFKTRSPNIAGVVQVWRR
jgi:hypothetical protein